MAAEAAQVLYPFASKVDDAGLRLAIASRPEADESYFKGFLKEPERDCPALLTVARVAQTRFFIPPGMLERILREADPVITANTQELHFEAFSQCCGVHARLDLGASAVEGEHTGRGTTNVDFNPPMREALTKMPHQKEGLRLSVGCAEFEVDAGDEGQVEKKVPLPKRWLKGFAESQALASRLEQRLELSGSEARAFLRSVPKSVGGTERTTLVPTRNGVRLSQRPSRDGFEAGGSGQDSNTRSACSVHPEARRVHRRWHQCQWVGGRSWRQHLRASSEPDRLARFLRRGAAR